MCTYMYEIVCTTYVHTCSGGHDFLPAFLHVLCALCGNVCLESKKYEPVVVDPLPEPSSCRMSKMQDGVYMYVMCVCSRFVYTHIVILACQVLMQHGR